MISGFRVQPCGLPRNDESIIKHRRRLEPAEFALDQLAWPGIATLPGLPSTAIPTGFAPDGLPVGVQIVGPWLEDRTPLRLAELIEREFGGFKPPKMFDD